MTFTAGAVALNISYEWILLTVLITDDDELASSKKHTQFKTRVLTPYSI